ncbi:MAG: toxin-antitoxin system YwqK family antitoxin, partial [Bdellovibrionota bacterium]
MIHKWMAVAVLSTGLVFSASTVRAEEADQGELSECLKLGKGFNAQVERYNADQIKSVTCTMNGENNGPFHSWFSDGKKESDGVYREGLRHGFWTYYYPSGKKKTDGPYQHGVKICGWNVYTEKGDVEVKQEAAPGGTTCAAVAKEDGPLPFVEPGEAVAEEPGKPDNAKGGFFAKLSDPIPLSWRAFEIQASFYYQNSLSYVISGGVSYVPRFLHLPFNLTLGARAGVDFAKDYSGINYPTAILQPFVNWSVFKGIYVEPGAGFATAFAPGAISAAGMFSTEVGKWFSFENKILRYFDKVWARYSYMWVSNQVPVVL